MCDQDHFEEDRLKGESSGLVTRRQFGALVAAGVALTLPKVVDAVAVTEMDVTIKTPDGTCDAYFVHPATGTAPGVLVWPDIFGLRPALQQMGKRLAEDGYSVLVVNPFYRQQKAPTAPQGAQTAIQSLVPMMQALTATTHTTDAKAFIAWLDARAEVDKGKKIGTIGYCMGGPIVFRTAAAVPNRVGAVGSFHGGGLTTMGADSPHLLIPQTKAQFLVAVAENDDMRDPTSKDILKKAFADAKVTADVEVYKAAHGWCPPDTTVYNKDEAERAWGKMLAMFKKSLA
jgi:carboxymethylenebutenolidase